MSVTVETSVSEIPHLVREYYHQDEQYVALLSNPDLYKCIIKEGLLYKGRLLYIPSIDVVKQQILQQHHDSPTAAHMGVAKTINLIKRNYYWPKLAPDVEHYIQTCHVCQRVKPSNQRPAGLLHPLPIPDGRWREVSMDMVTGLPKTKSGNDAIIVFVDRLTKMAHFAPTTKQVNGEGWAKLFINNVFRLHGMPLATISDRDPRLTAKFWESFSSLVGTKMKMTTAARPQADGQSERTIRSLIQMLRAHSSDHTEEWNEHLPILEFAYNNSKHASTQESPFFLNFGEHPRLPANVKATDKDPTAIKMLLEELHGHIETAKLNLAKAQQRQTVQANKKRRPAPEYNVGDRVLLSSRVFPSTVENNKLAPGFVGPFHITEKLHTNVYRLNVTDFRGRKHDSFNVEYLKLYEESMRFPHRSTGASAIAKDYQGRNTWDVEAIVGRRLHPQYGWQYKVKWVGWPLDEGQDRDFWQHKDFVDHNLLDFYNSTNPGGPTPSDARDWFGCKRKSKPAPTAAPKRRRH
jgi:hypothetical protein